MSSKNSKASDERSSGHTQLSKEESFEDWLNDNGYQDEFLKYEREAWNHQQAKLDKANGLAERFQELALIRHEVIIELERVKKELESENKRLRERTTELDGFLKTANSQINKVIEENKKLKEELLTLTKAANKEQKERVLVTDALKLAVEVMKESETLEWALMTLEDRLTFGMPEEQAYKRRERRVVGVLRDTINCYQKFLESEQYKKVEESL